MKHLALLLALLPLPALADYGSATVSQVTSIYDGDTTTVTVDEVTLKDSSKNPL